MTQTMPSISVIMPVFNGERYVDEAVASVLGQTYGNFEFIIINDGSTDATGSKLAAWVETDRRIRVIEQANQGVTRSLNVGVAIARGRFIARMDADDIALPERFEHQRAALEADPQLLAIGGCITVIDQAGRPIYPIYYPQGAQAIEQELLGMRNPLCHPCTIIRSEAIREVGGYRDGLTCAQDYDLWLRLCEHGKLDNLPTILLHYRQHAQSISWSRTVEQQTAVWRACVEACKRRGLTPPAAPKPERKRRQTPAARHAATAKKAFRAGYVATAKIHALDAIKAQAPIFWWPLMAMILLWPASGATGRDGSASSRQP